MHRTIIAALLAAGLAATSAVANPPPDKDAAAADAATATAAQKLLPVWREHSLLLIGEIHGTQETPAVVAALLRAQPRTQAVLLGLEIPRQEQAAIDAFLHSDGTAAARRSVLAGAFWRNSMQDGRSSAAMLDLLDAVRAARAQGAPIGVVCFDDTGAAADGLDRDARMAKALRSALAAHGRHPALIFSGNYHARLARGSKWNPNQEFMAGHLRDLDPFPINVSAGSGAYWACTPQCGVNVFGVGKAPATLALRVDDAVDADGYRGTLTLPSFHASLPAIQGMDG